MLVTLLGMVDAAQAAAVIKRFEPDADDGQATKRVRG